MGTHPIFESDFDCLTDMMADFDDDALLDKVTNYRWMASILMGPLWGLVGMHGIFGIALYGVLISILSIMIVKNHSDTAMELVGGFNPIVKEGGITAAAVFMITWIVSNTALN